MMDILISALAVEGIGTGHLRRMMTLAEELITRPGISVGFHTSDLGQALLAKSELSPALRPTLPAPSTSGRAVSHLTEIVTQSKPDALILDNYFWNAKTERPLLSQCGLLCVVDDLADRPHLANFLLDQNANHTSADYHRLVPPDCTLAVGSDFCLLPRPFRDIRREGLKSVQTQLANTRVFVSLGGGDPKGELHRIIRLMLDRTPYILTIATGSHIGDAAAIRALAEQCPDRIDLALDSNRVACQMASSGFAIASGGTMIWERATLGLPSLCLIIAENQANTSHWMEQQGMHSTFDMRYGWTDEMFISAVLSYGSDYARRKAHATNSIRLIGSEGVVEVVNLLNVALSHAQRNTLTQHVIVGG